MHFGDNKHPSIAGPQPTQRAGSCYCGSFVLGDGIKGRVKELRELRTLKLHTLYLGLESGNDKTLRWVRKREDAAIMIEATQRAQACQLRLLSALRVIPVPAQDRDMRTRVPVIPRLAVLLTAGLSAGKAKTAEAQAIDYRHKRHCIRRCCRH
jgi:hypothetical protein